MVLVGMGEIWLKNGMPRAGIEPARGYPRGILSPLRLPIPPPRQPLFSLPQTFQPVQKLLTKKCIKLKTLKKEITYGVQ